MSLSLVGIIFVQAYYINNSVENEKKQFKANVTTALYNVSNTITSNEEDKYFAEFKNLPVEKRRDSVSVSKLFIYQKDDDKTILYNSGVLEQDTKFSPSIFDVLELDSMTVKQYSIESKLEVFDNSSLGDKDISNQSPITSIINNSKLLEAHISSFKRDFRALVKEIPIHKRVSKEQIRASLLKALEEHNIDIDYEFAIYSNGLATKVGSNGFEYDKKSTFGVPIFPDENKQTPYKLLVNFPNDGKFILSSILGMILLSVIFTSVIIIAYSSALFQLVKQRKISEIKTDFINNMTHEFKTPIATINLALDAIKNPKIIDDKEKVVRYLNMIKEENKRMHAQVENVLRISKLEKNELNISKDRVNLTDIIEDAITHVKLIVEDRQGYIKTYLNATDTTVLASQMHFTNVVVNILDNAIKYSPEAPRIEVYTENVGTNILLKIKDHGSGMSKAVAKRVFEKFYRESMGDIHNVKGHGLGLAYVKRIVDDHQGHVSVESEKGNGSTFTIKLPIIT